MPRKIFLPLCFLVLFCVRAFPAVFVVTSNADSGPGTLRDALTQAAANGSAVKDSIWFNIADLSEAGRTITLVTQLPDVSSNLVIDGTTQAGTVFGRSNARIEISTPLNYIAITVFNGSGLNNVKFYGLYIFDYYDINTSYPDLKPRSAIHLINSTNITVGAPNRGNMIRGFYGPGLYFEATDGITIQSNIIGLGKSNTIGNDGYTGYSGAYTGTIYINNSNHILLGGPSTAEGNIIFTMIDIDFYQQTQNSVLAIQSNNFCVYQDGVTTEWYFEFYRAMIRITTNFSNNIPSTYTLLDLSASVDMDISNNVGASQMLVFGLSYLKGTVNFTSNCFNVARDGVTDITTGTQISPGIVPIDIRYSSAQLNVGTNDIAKRNFFHNAGVIVNVANDPNIFIRYNDYKCVGTPAYANYIPPVSNYNPAVTYTLPVVSITGSNTNGAHTLVTGTSTPNALIDIYSSESCSSQCSIRSYLQTVNADNSGRWQADILNLSGIFFVSATLNNQASLFETFQVNSDSVKITPLRCNKTASITGLVEPSGLSYYWIDSKGNVVSTDLNLTTNMPGNYQLVLGNGCITSSVFTIADDRLAVFDAGAVKTDASCGQKNGSIKGLYVNDPLLKYKENNWFDASGKIVGTTTGSLADISNLSPGTYLLKALTTDGCETDYGPVVIQNSNGPNIDQTNASIQPTNCGKTTGSITNITATGAGTLKYSWKNSQQQEVSTSLNLTNQPAGTYTLQVTDDSQCGPVYTTAITIPETNSITLDESNVKTAPAGCNGPTGSVTGIVVAGATQYQWADATNKLVASSLDLQNAAPGAYTLTALNAFCSITSKSYTINQIPPTQYPAYPTDITLNCFGKSNGSVTVEVDTLVKIERWVNAQGQTIRTGIGVAQQPAGIYFLYLTDKNGCETLYGSYTIPSTTPLVISAGSGQIAVDQCGLKVASITNVHVSGGVPPYTYQWVDVNDNTIGTKPELNNIGEGTYILRVNDATTCGLVADTFKVENQNMLIPPPSVSNLQICSAGEALLNVNNPSAAYSYRLYASATGGTPIDQQAKGSFKISAKNNTAFFVSTISGTCESERVEVQVTVGLSTVDIANAFTPNGDGVNEYWKISGIENYPNATVQVFTRNGQKVFDSKGYARPFDGTYGGKNLPVGVYYYIINLSTNCNLLSGSVTILR